jgi:cyclophilin family peptidyl-prolyl cis-trans isomerase
MRRLTTTLLTVSALALAACGDDEETAGGGGGEGSTARTQETTAATAPTTSGCERGRPAKPREIANRKRPTFRVKRGKAYTAEVATTCGTLTIRLAAGRSPKTVSSFVALAREDFFDGLIFHRIVPDFVAQGGDPLGVGQGGPGYEVAEAPPSDTAYTRGTVAMAKGPDDPPGTSGSQFFIVTGADAGLPPEYALLGKVEGDAEVLKRLGQVPVVPTDPEDPTVDNRPIDPVVIKDVVIGER